MLPKQSVPVTEWSHRLCDFVKVFKTRKLGIGCVLKENGSVYAGGLTSEECFVRGSTVSWATAAPHEMPSSHAGHTGWEQHQWPRGAGAALISIRGRALGAGEAGPRRAAALSDGGARDTRSSLQERSPPAVSLVWRSGGTYPHVVFTRSNWLTAQVDLKLVPQVSPRDPVKKVESLWLCGRAPGTCEVITVMGLRTHHPNIRHVLAYWTFKLKESENRQVQGGLQPAPLPSTLKQVTRPSRERQLPCTQ